MSTDSNADIFYQVKKQILDKLDIILQKVNLQIINSTHERGSSHPQDFTFIQLSHFQLQISTLFQYLDKLYDSLNSSVSGYASQAQPTTDNTALIELQNINDKLLNQNKQLKTIVSQNQIQLQSAEKELKKYQLGYKKLANKLRQLSKIAHIQPQEVSMLKKAVANKLKQFKFQMLQTRVEIISKIKEHEQVQMYREKQMSYMKDKQSQEVGCHHLNHDQINIINQLNQILKIC